MHIKIFVVGALCFLTMACSVPSAQRADPRPTVHPLDALSAAEIERATSVLRQAGRLGPAVRFVILETAEPDKAAVAQQIASGAVRRIARAVLYDWATGTTTESGVDLASSAVVSTTTMATGDPPVKHVTLSRATEIAAADPRVLEALKRRGINPDRVTFIGAVGEGQTLERRGGSRFVNATAYTWDAAGELASDPAVFVRVDLTRGVVDGVQSSRGPSEPVRPRGAVDVGSPLPPLRVSQPAGPGFRIEGSRIEWDNWRIHFAIHPRRSLEVFDVSFREGNRYRPVLYRASVAEVMTPYGDPEYGSWYPRDEGNYGMTSYSAARASAIVGADAPEHATFTAATIAGSAGQPVTIDRAVAIYERDGGVLWRHAGTGRRARQLVLSAYSTLDNYDYLFHWIFNQDGAIEVQVQLTGMMNVRPAGGRAHPIGPDGTPLHFAHTVAPGIDAPHHQHFFSWRLDFDVDGTSNRLLEVNTQNAQQVLRDSSGEWFAMAERPLRSERDAQRDMDLASARRWLVANYGVRNPLGQPTAFALLPGENAPPLQSATSAPRRRAPFLNHHVWATRYAPGQMYASGEWVAMPGADEGVHSWSEDDESLMDQDLVLWYTHSVVHLPRPEDWPIMPSYTAGFRLVPVGFFGSNPTYTSSR